MKLKIRAGKEMRMLAGAIMAIAGVLVFTGHIYVASNMFSRGIPIGKVTLNTGVLLVPFVLGVVFAFMKPKKVWPRYVIGFGLLLMLVAAMASVNLRVGRIAIASWLLILVLIFGGLVLMAGAVKLEKKKKN